MQMSFARRSSLAAAMSVLITSCSSPPAPVTDSPNGTTTGVIELVRDHAVRPTIDASGTIIAVIAFEDAAFETLTGVLVHDLRDRTVSRADVATDGTPSDASFMSGDPVMSSDGGSVAFVSEATTLVSVSDDLRNVFVKDLTSGAVAVVTLADVDALTGCVARPDLGSDGRLVLLNHNSACYTSSFAPSSMYLKDTVVGSTRRVSHDGFERSQTGALSADGRFVAFESEDNDAVVGDTNGTIDVFLRELASDALTRVSLTHDGSQPNAAVFLSPGGLSDDGRFVLLRSWATNVVPDDTNAFSDVFLYDRLDGSIRRVSTTQDGSELDGATFDARLSGDGRYVVFATLARNIAPGLARPGTHRLFVKDVSSGAVARLDVPEGGDPDLGIRNEFALSGNGRFVVFVSGEALVDAAEPGSLAVYRTQNPLWTP
jgi:Tol biopolymer transport system component